MFKKIIPIAVVVALAVSGSMSCKKGGSGSFKKINGVEYAIIKDSSAPNAKVGDFMEFHLVLRITNPKTKKDTVLVETRKMNMGKPVPNPVAEPKFRGDWGSAFTNLSAGDSAVIRVEADTLKTGIMSLQKDNKTNPLPPFIQSGDILQYELKIVTVKTKDEYQKDMMAKQAEMQKEMQDKAAQQAPVDDKIIQDYLAKNNVKAQKTASGIYYVIHKEGSGSTIEKGQNVSINYTGKTLDGKMFDSNTDPAKGHVKPFTFVVGNGQVIPGWDEGTTLLKKGSKATLYIPSPLAYGPRGAGGDIAPNTVLMFDMEVTDVTSAPKQ